MNLDQESLQKLEGKELEEYGNKIFNNIGLTCFSSLGQIRLSTIASGYAENEHIEFDYIIPNNKICLIGEITARDDKEKIKKKYDKFIKQINIIKNIEFSEAFWIKLGIQQKDIRPFREIDSIKAFFITTKKEKCDVSLSEIKDIAVFYKSDFLKVIEYSETIGRWTQNYFLSNFNVNSFTNNAIAISEKNNSLLISKNKKISSKDIPLSDLYTFTISPYDLLEIAHVHRKDELPSMQDNTYNYQRLLNSDKLKTIRKNLLNDPDFMFPSNILVVLSKECKYTKDGTENYYLHIPKKYGSISITDGQHRLFSYADESIKSIIQNDCKIQVTAINFKVSDEKLIGKYSAKIFVEVNINQTRVEISHLDQIAYELGSDDPKVIATKIIVTMNSRKKFSSFFDINSDKINKGIVDAGTIIDAIKKITSLAKIKKLENARTEKTKLKRAGYEKLFDCNILALSQKEILVEKGTTTFERYFNEIFYTFENDKLKDKKEIKSSFVYSKFWAGFVDLLSIFIEEGLDWNQVKDELNKIKANVIKLREIDTFQIDKSTEPLFYSKDAKIPDASSSPKKTCTFLEQNRKNPVSIQDIN
ncbi:DGQHR domain-containing protein [Pleurocapsa sp. CCALA 161]|uniref:DGQHR domain-containing protein n=1 Tax=Pleurocapsa sp. CCALA 161 TaxID=2107688 RepID=UPI000D07A0AA|nr:DGQHR domain-containing protein [Pleurocapsa sp. CCALA 161]PSB09017.1 DGQHR domain-containing protein [Pleurocapsa sp. CCALA 161]